MEANLIIQPGLKKTDHSREVKMNVLINHPNFGSIWLSNAKIEDGYVIGDVWDDSSVGSPYLSEDYMGQFITMNFPVSCIRKEEIK